MLEQQFNDSIIVMDTFSLIIIILIGLYFYVHRRTFRNLIGYFLYILILCILFWLYLVNFLKWSISFDLFYDTEEYLEIIEICSIIFLVYFLNQRANSLEIESYQRALLEHEKYDYIERLSAGIVHDLNNIIGVIDSCTTLMRMEYEKNTSVELKKLDPYLEEINKQASRAKEIASSVRALSKPTQQAIFLKENISNILNDIINSPNSHKNVQIINEIEPNINTMAVKTDIVRVFQNIIKNAFEAMPNGGILTIKLTNSNISEDIKAILKNQNLMRIEISDTGTGIRPELLKDIFKPYFTTKPTGTGLGLPISKSIIEKHKGTILVDSKLNEGTKFTIYLPFLNENQL